MVSPWLLLDLLFNIIPHIFVFKLTLFPLASNMNPRYVNRILSVNFTIKQRTSHTLRLAIEQATICIASDVLFEFEKFRWTKVDVLMERKYLPRKYVKHNIN